MKIKLFDAFSSNKDRKNLDFKLSTRSFWGINILIIILVTYGFYINTQYLKIKKNISITNSYSKFKHRCDTIKEILFLIKDSPPALLNDNILNLKAELVYLKDINEIVLENYENLSKVKKSALINSIENVPITLIKLYENDKNIKNYTLHSLNEEYEAIYVLINARINDQINSLKLALNHEIEYCIFATLLFVCLYLVVFIIGYYSIYYPSIINLELAFVKKRESQNNLQIKLEALKHMADRLNTEVPHKLSKDEIKTAVIENREDERLILSSHLEHLEYLLEHSIHNIENVDFSDLIELQSKMKDTQFDLQQIYRELTRHKFNLLPSDIMNRGLIPSIVLFCKYNNKYSSIQFKFVNKNKIQTTLHYIHEINLYRLIVNCAEMITENHYYKIGLFTLSVVRNDWQLIFHFSIKNSYLKDDESKKTIKNISDRYFHIIKRAALIETSVTQYTHLSLITDVYIVYPFNKK